MKLRLLLLLALAACSDRKAAQPPPASLTAAKPATVLIPKTTKQLVTAVVDDWTSTKATLRLWGRTETEWKPQGDPWPAVVGHSGSGWGIGVHGTGAPNREGPLKKEGDGKSPAGVFKINGVYGVAEEPPQGTKLAYETTAHGDWQCVDDPGSEHYAEIIDRKQVPSDWESAEELLRDDTLYTWVVDVGHNPDRARGKGSCIFLHVWRDKDSTTVGCTAMEEPRLAQLISTLDPKAEPLFVLLPRADYAALAPAWGLPPL
ncbi:MAG TPA: L,D-transpeptidase family protein [Kofleriaceae bacterium]|nr:L,D-transpeptidase family protein [Kofleriaceae bacterium]